MPEETEEQIQRFKAYERERVKKWYRENQEHVKQYREANKERVKQYIQDHKEAISERAKKYREEHKDVVRERERKYREENKVKINEQRRVRNQELREKGELPDKREYMKEYRANHQAEIHAYYLKNKDRLSAEHKCDVCGGYYTCSNKSRHAKSKKHTLVLSKQLDQARSSTSQTITTHDND